MTHCYKDQIISKYGLNRIAQGHGRSYPLAQKFIQRNFYVDDGLCSVDNIRITVSTSSEVSFHFILRTQHNIIE